MGLFSFLFASGLGSYFTGRFAPGDAAPVYRVVAAIVGLGALFQLLGGPLFAAAMAWQGLFIFLVSNFQGDYYYDEIFYLRDELEGSTGYLFLAAMVVTSFEFGRNRLTPAQWKLLHKSGINFLWAYPFSVYWWNLSYYPDPLPWDYVMYLMGFAAFAALLNCSISSSSRNNSNRRGFCTFATRLYKSCNPFNSCFFFFFSFAKRISRNTRSNFARIVNACSIFIF